MNEHHYFTSGEFAALCHTTKETLRHYHQKGILCPEITGENGYYYYSAKQFFQFDLIELLTNTGSSLHAVNSCLKNHTPIQFEQLLREREPELRREKEQIEKALRLVHKSLAIIEESRKQPCGVIYEESCTEEYFSSYAIDPLTWDRPRALSEAMCLFLAAMEQAGTSCEYPYSCIVTQEDFFNHSFNPSYLTEKLDAPANVDGLITKPAGTYLCINHHGSYDEIGHTYEYLIKHMEQKKLKPRGPAYESELIGIFMTASERDYIIKISVQIGLPIRQR